MTPAEREPPDQTLGPQKAAAPFPLKYGVGRPAPAQTDDADCAREAGMPSTVVGIVVGTKDVVVTVDVVVTIDVVVTVTSIVSMLVLANFG